ncbi:hypothetical protein Tco_0680631 [Tanacetum coccineum]|uniref:DUF4283 domain-containing protein n=1 Tax=Tanacetum coccineum TaxID=301880 RepID=A0ABQ4XLX1_9ASTR
MLLRNSFLNFTEVVLPSVDESVAMEVHSPLVEQTNAVKFGGESYPPLPTQGTTPAENTPVESIRDVSDRFANSAYGFFLGKRFSSMDGLNAMLENGLWFIRSHLIILKKWNPNVNLLKKDVGNVLGRSSYARVMIELQAGVELKDTIVVAMPKINCPKNPGLGAGAGEKKKKKSSQAPKGILVGPKMAFKPNQEYRPVPKKNTTNSSGNKKKAVDSTNKVSDSNPFEVLNSVDNDVEMVMGNAILVDEASNPIKKIEYSSDHDSKDEVASVDNDMARDSYDNGDYDEDPYDDDMYEGQNLSEEIQTICDKLDIRGIVVNVVNMERGFLSSGRRGVKQNKVENTVQPTMNKKNNHTDSDDGGTKDSISLPNMELNMENLYDNPNEAMRFDQNLEPGFLADLNKLAGTAIRKLNDDGDKLTKRIVTITDSPTDFDKSGPSFSGPTLYAKLVIREPSRKSVDLCTLLAPAGNGANVATSLESVRAISIFSSKDGMDAMLENRPWFIRNNLFILKKWDPDVNLLKEDDGSKLGIESFESAKELSNQTKPADAEKVQEVIVEEGVKNSGITLLRNMTFDELYGNDANRDAEESPFDTESEIRFIGKVDPKLNDNDSQFNIKNDQGAGFTLMDQEMTKADSDLESMPDDEIVFVSGFEEADSDDSENAEEISMADEATADNMINEFVDVANSQDANPNVSAAKAIASDLLGHLQDDITSLASKVNNLESSLSKQVADKNNDLVPRMVADVFEERIPDLLADTLKNILPKLLKDSVKNALPKFDKQVKKTVKAEVPNLILKPLNKEFNCNYS